MEKDEILYHPLARSSSSSGSSDSGDERVEIITIPQHRRRCGSHCMVFFSSACLMASIAFCVFTIAYKSQLATDANCTRRMSTYSPLIEDDLIRYHPRKYEGDFFKPSIYRGQPTLEKEEAWLGLWDHGPLVIPVDDLPKLNKTKDLPWLKAPPKYGDSVISTLEVHHQLHCLSTLRHWAYREEVLALPGEPPELLKLDKRIVWEHLDHCLEMLRLNIMCVGDVTPVLYINDPATLNGHRLDFSTQHKCRNYEGINQWVEDHKVHEFV